jgi:NAD(P)-dependent dehydrogenase (short-subunit alcohol dehydrogenase family)
MLSGTTKLRALVVGGTSGIGHGIALALAKRGDVEVTIAGRSAARGGEIVSELQALSPDHKHTFEPVDGFDLSTFRDLAHRKQGKVDLLIMTHGMATIQGYTPTIKDGIDQKLQLHYFSRFYLTQLMAPKMKDGSRVLTVLSAGIHGRYATFEKDFALSDGSYSIKNAADAAGFYTDAGFEGIANKHDKLIIAHACPGFVNTNWGTEMPTLVRMAIRPLQSLFAKSSEDCGDILTKGLMDISEPGYKLIDEKGGIVDNESGLKHTALERDVIWAKTLEILPDL